MNSLPQAGHRLAIEYGLDTCGDRGAIWALTIEAAQTFAHMPNPQGARGLPSRSTMPDPYRPPWEIFAVERDRLKDGVKVATEVRHQPASDAHTRAFQMHELWFHTPRIRRVLGKDSANRIKALWLYAGGARPKSLQQLFSIRRDALHRYKWKCCEIIAETVYPKKNHATYCVGNKCDE